ncbi:MAG: 1-deoxy-D-xylulose-5-phosphate synthase, partial [Campylobacterales bacterium]
MLSMEIKDRSPKELEEVCESLREKILETVSNNGGHLSSALGAVELIVGMHYVFDVDSDPFIYDVSHQAYAHKLLTDRWDSFHTLRTYGGISGFIKPSESPYDYFVAGHSSTSISVALGAAKAIELNKEQRCPVALIGDGSMSSGMVYEALNELGDRKYPVVIILNDNEMSISHPIGAISKYLSKVIAGEMFQGLKKKIDRVLSGSESASYLAKRFEESLKLITPGLLFEELGIDYIGPIDGNCIEDVVDTLRIAKKMNLPVIVHAQTTKGKGYEKAEGKLEHWHGVGPFDVKSGEFVKKSSTHNPTKTFAKKLLTLADNDEKIVGVTAAMPSGTGMDLLIKNHPDRFWDVAIAEQHAVTSMASLAKEGFKPFVAIYSTFLQRALDQIVHDVALQKLPVKFAIDRAGIVGEDGETHQGIYDISYLSMIPNIEILSPVNGTELHAMIKYSLEAKSPVAIRYPKGDAGECDFNSDLQIIKGQSTITKQYGDEVVIFSFGPLHNNAKLAVEKLRDQGSFATLVNLRFAKPLDEKSIIELSQRADRIYTLEDHALIGGVGSQITQLLNKHQIYKPVFNFAYPDQFVHQGSVKEIYKEYGMDVESLV